MEDSKKIDILDCAGWHQFNKAFGESTTPGTLFIMLSREDILSCPNANEYGVLEIAKNKKVFGNVLMVKEVDSQGVKVCPIDNPYKTHDFPFYNDNHFVKILYNPMNDHITLKTVKDLAKDGFFILDTCVYRYGYFEVEKGDVICTLGINYNETKDLEKQNKHVIDHYDHSEYKFVVEYDGTEKDISLPDILKDAAVKVFIKIEKEYTGYDNVLNDIERIFDKKLNVNEISKLYRVLNKYSEENYDNWESSYM